MTVGTLLILPVLVLVVGLAMMAYGWVLEGN